VDRQEQLVLARREEAQALLRAGLETKERSDRVLALGVTVTGVAAAAGIANEFEPVMLGVPTAFSLLLAYVFQLYSDTIAFGVARKRVEEVLAFGLHEDVLIAETVAPVRHGRVNPSIPLTQGVYLLLAGGSTVAGFAVAWNVSHLVVTLYLIVTLLAGAALAASVRDMRRVWQLARNEVGDWPRDR